MAAEMFAVAYDWFWCETFWLPTNVSWSDFEDDDGNCYPRASALYSVFPLACLLFIIRLIWERWVALPIGRSYGLKEVPARTPEPNRVLESAYKSYHRVLPDNEELDLLAKKAGMMVRQVERWWRRRRTMGKASDMQRFQETSWRFLFYFTIFWYGMVVLWDKQWFWDTRHCWYGFPKQHIDREIYWYYIIELSFYWSLVISLFMDVRRKDFKEMVVHHVATISLMQLSWCNNMVRVGTLVLLVHDAVDYWLEGAKLLKYLKYHRVCDYCFVIFTVMWFVTRLVIYPVRVLYSSMVESYILLQPFASYYVFNGFLLVLQVLHVIWFYMIMRAAYTFIVKGKLEKDARSDTDPASDSGEDTLIHDDDVTTKPLNGNNNVCSNRSHPKKKVALSQNTSRYHRRN